MPSYPPEPLEHCAERIAAFKVPQRVVFVEECPTTASGRIRKVLVGEAYADLYAGG